MRNEIYNREIGDIYFRERCYMLIAKRLYRERSYILSHSEMR